MIIKHGNRKNVFSYTTAKIVILLTQTDFMAFKEFYLGWMWAATIFSRHRCNRICFIVFGINDFYTISGCWDFNVRILLSQKYLFGKFDCLLA